MPPRSFSDRSPVSVMRWTDDYSVSSAELKQNEGKGKGEKGSVPLVKSVKFAEHNEVVEIPHINLMPDEVIAKIWYNAKEYAEIKSNYQVTIFMMEAGEKFSNDEHTSRGLEYRTQEGAWARYENKRDAYNAVLDEQDDQWKKDVDDQEAISRVYLEHSAKCLKAAQARGKKDFLDIQEYLLTPEKPKLKKKKKVKTSSSSSKERRGSATGVGEAQQVLKERSSSKRTEVRNDIKRESEKKQVKVVKTKSIKTKEVQA